MSDLYSFLRSYGLDNKNFVERRLNSFSERRLETMLESYSELASQRGFQRREPGTTDVYPDSEAGLLPEQMLKQLGVYVNCCYLQDPIASSVLRFRGIDNYLDMVQHPLRKERVAKFKYHLAKDIISAIRMKPMSDAGFIQFVPMDLFNKPDPTAIYASSLYGPDGQLGAEDLPPLPPTMVEFVNQRIKVHPARFHGTTLVIPTDGNLTPTNIIAVEIDGDPRPRLYFLSQFNVADDSEQVREGLKKFNMTFDISGESKPTAERFERWVRGETDKTIRGRVKRLDTDLQFASSVGAHFLTTLTSSAELAQLNMSPSPEEVPVVNALMRLPLPYLESISFADLARARKNEAAFEEFRVALRKGLQEVEGLEAKDFQKRVDEIAQDLIHAPLARIDERMKSLTQKVLTCAGLAVGTFAITLLSSGLTLAAAATLAAAGTTYLANKDDQRNVRRMPSYFYWDMTKFARKRS